MSRELFDHKIEELLDEILKLSTTVEEAIIGSVEALKARDLKASKKIYKADKKINAQRFRIESDAITLIATQAPVAHDMRLLASVLDIASELERMGDYAKGIANINMKIGDTPLIKPLIDVPRMAELTVEMLHQAIEAFIAADADLARKIPLKDDDVDALYNQVYRELLTFMIADPTTIDNATYLLWVAHNLERAADRVTNICERTVFVKTGELIEFKATDDENRIDEIVHSDN